MTEPHPDGPAATCGDGLAEQARPPERLGRLVASVGRILEVHMTALDLTDPTARSEHDAYAELADAYHRIADELAAVADRMAGHRDLPMGRHDQQVMSGAEARDAFADFVDIKRQVGEMLQATAELDRRMLDGFPA